MKNRIKDKINLCQALIDVSDYILPEIKLRQTSVFELLKSPRVSQLDFVGQDMLTVCQKPNTPLNDEENKAVGEFFYSLGKYDVANQIKQIEYFKAYMSKALNKYEEMYKSKAKIYITFSLSFGMVLSLVLI